MGVAWQTLNGLATLQLSKDLSCVMSVTCYRFTGIAAPQPRLPSKCYGSPRVTGAPHNPVILSRELWMTGSWSLCIISS